MCRHKMCSFGLVCMFHKIWDITFSLSVSQFQVYILFYNRSVPDKGRYSGAGENFFSREKKFSPAPEPSSLFKKSEASLKKLSFPSV